MQNPSHTSLQLPKPAAKYITFQRLETQSIGKNIHYTGFGKIAYKIYESFPPAQWAFHQYSTKIEPQLRATSILSSYSNIMANEYTNIAPHLPKTANKIVGIGAGVGGLEILLAQHYKSKGQTPVITMIDKNGIDSTIKFGFKDVAAVYNSLELSKQALEMNGHPAEKIELVEASESANWAKNNQGKVDVITSLIAWGFHFPVKTYLELARTCLSKNGCLIIDVRKETTGIADLKTAFNNVQIILDDAKFERALCTQPKA